MSKVMNNSNAVQTCTRRFPIGAELLEDGRASFRVWAPDRKKCHVILQNGHEEANRFALEKEANGYFSGVFSVAKNGTRYGYTLDGDSRVFADPASRCQPDGPSGLSCLVDPEFPWTDSEWKGIDAHGQVIYEMHIGTFTEEGTWTAAVAELKRLRDLGITALEIMPVAECPGRFNWGYDGVLMFAPYHVYGTPDDMRKFIDYAHSLNLGVILDVVYNHFGIAENYIYEFSKFFKSNRYKNEWADAINFDGDQSKPVREFFVANAQYWIEEFHLDGFRFDAIQAIFDSSTPHIMSEITDAAKTSAGSKKLYLSAEIEPQDVRAVRPTSEDGFGATSMWNDDFHHLSRVTATNRNAAYFSDYTAHAQEYISAIKYGFIYQGQRSQWQNKRRGSPTFGLTAHHFVCFLQNHDQVANTGTGERLHQLTSPGRYRALTALWLLMPQTPLFFQGQEYCADTPFRFFADFQDDFGKSVAKGRADFLSQFPDLASKEGTQSLPNPTQYQTFMNCRLSIRERDANNDMTQFHSDLLKLRKTDPLFSRQRADLLDGAVINDDCFLIRYFGDEGADRLLIVNFGKDLKYQRIAQPLLATPVGRKWSILWSSDSTSYGGRGTMTVLENDQWFFPGESTYVFEAVSEIRS